MANRSPRHLKPGQANLRDRRSLVVCRCCDPLIDHRGKVRAIEATVEMRGVPRTAAAMLAGDSGPSDLLAGEDTPTEN